MSSYTTNAGNVGAALLEDGVADTLASGNTSASRQPSRHPLEVRERPCRSDRHSPDQLGAMYPLVRMAEMSGSVDTILSL